MDLQTPQLADGTPVAAPQAAAEDWDWEAFRVGGRLYLYCYLRETVLIKLTSEWRPMNFPEPGVEP